MASHTDRIRAWCERNRAAVLFNEPASELLDVFSGKTLRIDVRRIQETQEKTARDTGEIYLLVYFEDGRQLALAQAGVAFPPDPRNAGPLPLPAVVCWRDFEAVREKVEHVVEAHPEDLNREVLDMFRFCIALVDGARALGFDVSVEEAALDKLLGRIEAIKAGT